MLEDGGNGMIEIAEISKILSGRQIILRAIEPINDGEHWFTVMQDKEMHRWTGNRIPENVDETIELLTCYRDHNELIAWVIVDKDTDLVIGTYWIAKPKEIDGDLVIEDEAQRLSPSVWRMGVMKEARKLVYGYAFNQLGVKEIHAHAWSRNINSCKSMESVGFVKVREYEKYYDKYKENYMESHYRLDRDQWLVYNL